MRKKTLLPVLAGVLALSASGALLAACNNGDSGYNKGDYVVDNNQTEYYEEIQYNEDGDVIGSVISEKYTGQKINIKYLIGDESYITLAGRKADELTITGFEGEFDTLDLAEIEKRVQVDKKPISVVGIADGAFYGAEALKKVDLRKNTPSVDFNIGEGAFAYCVNLESVQLPDDVYVNTNTIGMGAFAYCTSLHSAEIGEKFTNIENGAFAYCIELPTIKIPTKAKKIAPSTFEGCESLTSISISNDADLRSIQERAFYHSGLSSLDLGALSDLRYIGTNAFSGTALSTVTLTDSLTYIGNNAFYDCDNLSTVTVPFLGNAIDQPRSFNTIFGRSTNPSDEGYYPRSITLTVNKAVTISDNMFYNSGELIGINIKAYADPGDYRVYESNGTEFRVTKLRADGMTGGNVTIYKKVGDAAFAQCSNLYSVSIPSDTDEIGNSAFASDGNLNSFTIPATVERIGQRAFAGCDDITAIEIPKATISVGAQAFDGCSSLTTLTINELSGFDNSYTYYEHVPSKWFLTSDPDFTSRVTTVNVKSALTIPNDSFADFGYLTAANITMTAIPVNSDDYYYYQAPAYAAIGANAFADCVSLELSGLKITEASNKIAAIGAGAFTNCYLFTSYTITSDIKSVGNGVFSGCFKMESITVEKYNWIDVVSDESNKLLPQTYKRYGKFGNASSTSPVVGSWFGNSVSDNSDSFYTDDNGNVIPKALKTVTLGNVTQLAAEFNGWTDLETVNVTFTGSVVVPNGNQYTPGETVYEAKIAASAFKNCGEAEINLTGADKIDTIGANAFRNCDAVDNDFAAAFTKITVIGERAFAGCENLTVATLPATLVSIGSNVFYDCSNVTQLNVGNFEAVSGLKSLFGNSSELDSKYNGSGVPLKLVNVTISNIAKLDDLTANTFANMSTVKAVSLNLTGGETVAKLTNNYFGDCLFLEKVYVPETLTAIYLDGSLSSSTAKLPVAIGDAEVYNKAPATITVYGKYWHTVTEGEGEDEVTSDKVVEDLEAFTEATTYTLHYNNFADGEEEGEDNLTVVSFVDPVAPAAEGEEEEEEEAPVKKVTILKQSDVETEKLVKEGFKFVGWYTSSTFEDNTLVKLPFYKAGATHLFAKWVANADYSDVAVSSENFVVDENNSKKFTYTDTTVSGLSFVVTANEAKNVTLTFSVAETSSYITVSARLTVNGVVRSAKLPLSDTVSFNLNAGDKVELVINNLSTYYANEVEVTYAVAATKEVAAKPATPTYAAPYKVDYTDIFTGTKGVKVTGEEFDAALAELGSVTSFTAHATYGNGLVVDGKYQSVGGSDIIWSNTAAYEDTMFSMMYPCYVVRESYNIYAYICEDDGSKWYRTYNDESIYGSVFDGINDGKIESWMSSTNKNDYTYDDETGIYWWTQRVATIGSGVVYNVSGVKFNAEKQIEDIVISYVCNGYTMFVSTYSNINATTITLPTDYDSVESIIYILTQKFLPDYYPGYMA